MAEQPPVLVPPDMPEDVCYACGERVPTEGYYRACGECFHAWATEADLVAHDLRIRRELAETPLLRPDLPAGLFESVDDVEPQPRRGDEIWVCPCCAHDF